MASFKALNIESEDESEVEIDDTKELQVEDALKLYQNAVKYHSEGPQSYAKAAEAYKALFESEIFKYPESQNELNRIERYGPPTEQDFLLDEQADTLFEPILFGEGAPSTLPQVLHLAHKNYGDFILDEARARLDCQSDRKNISWAEVQVAATSALEHFVDALDKDDSDIDVWRQASLVGESLDSHRIARFCLEAILDDEEDNLNDILATPGFEETLAAKQLCLLAGRIHDILSLHQSPLDDMKRRKLKTILVHAFTSPDPNSALANLKSEDSLARQSHQRSSTAVQTISGIASWMDLASVLTTTSSSEAERVNFIHTGLIRFVKDSEGETSRLARSQSTSISYELPSPSDFEQVYPGFDGGQPTVPLPAFGDLSLLRKSSAADSDSQLWTRKRSSDAAGIEPPDTGRVKSKRLRARESIVDGVPVAEDTLFSAKKPKRDPYEETYTSDAWCFNSADHFLERAGLELFSSATARRPDRESQKGSGAAVKNTPLSEGYVKAAADLYSLLVDTPERLIRPNMQDKMEENDDGNSQQTQMLNAIEGDTKMNLEAAPCPALDTISGLEEFLHALNSSPLTAREAAYTIIQLFLKPGMPLQPTISGTESSYAAHKWRPAFKESISRLLLQYDDYVYRCAATFLETVETCEIADLGLESASQLPTLVTHLAYMIQSIFELQLETFARIKHGSKPDDNNSFDEQRFRVEKWSELTRAAMRLRREHSHDESALHDRLSLRYLWASTAHLRAADETDKPTILSYYQELRSILLELGEPSISLPNNEFLPLLCIQTIDRQIARLTTSDFFEKVFGSANSDTVAVIEGLEPLLEYIHAERLRIDGPDNKIGNLSSGQTDHAPLVSGVASSPTASTELIDFLCKSSDSVIIALWRRLLQAYQDIEYIPMVAVCYFKIIEVTVHGIAAKSTEDEDHESRQTTLMKSVHQVHVYLMKVLEMTKVATDVMECMDDHRLKSLMSALVSLLKVLQSANFAEDEIRVGERTPPFEKDASRAKTYRLNIEVIRNAQLSLWVVFYMVTMELAKQNTDQFPPQELDINRMEFLRSVHTAIGLRGFCGGSNRILLNLLKKELPGLKHVAGYDFEFSQVLVDLYDLNCFVNPSWEQLPHDCARDVSLDRAAAVQAVDLILMQASKIKPSELYKHPIKDAIEKVHVVVARKKLSDDILRNREIYKQFFQSPIRPIELFRCLKGDGQVDLVSLSEKVAVLANKGWYFMMGNIALTKWRSQKRAAPSPTDELDTAISYLSQDLEYGSDKWETWYRLAQAFDSKLDESVTWNADRLNTSMEEVAQVQRSAIHCYRMALALALRITDPEFESSANVAELYADFAARMYSSSRPPFSMKAFSLQGAVRYLSTTELVKVPSFQPLTEYQAWKFARVLFQRAIAGNRGRWLLHYMEGKCLWKMYNAGRLNAQISNAPQEHQVLSAFQRAIELLPKERKDKKEPVLEPHYKLVAVVHKLMTHRDPAGRQTSSLSLQDACEILSTTPYARNVDRPEDFDDWDRYTLNILKRLRSADKANWHHRMIARSANIIYGDVPQGTEVDFTAALGAKHELTQQLFTKTMVLQVWRPELERSGRHFIYTVQYTRLFMAILERLGDKPSMESLVRRVSRRKSDYFGHAELWADISQLYLRMLRRLGKVAQGQEANTFGTMEMTEFQIRKEQLEAFCKASIAGEHDVEDDGPLNLLRDIFEFKKISQGLGKIGALDDLIGDVYAHFFDTTGKELWKGYQEKERLEKEQKAAEMHRRTEERLAQERRTMMNLNNLIVGAEPVQVTSQPPQQDAVMNLDLTAPGEVTPVKRKIGIGRREVRHSAEACVALFTTSAPEKAEPVKMEPQIILDRRPSGFSIHEYSVHDSADESELSDVDEDVINDGGSPRARSSMFPGLMGQGEEVDDGEEGDGEDGEDEEEAEENDGAEENGEEADDNDNKYEVEEIEVGEGEGNFGDVAMVDEAAKEDEGEEEAAVAAITSGFGSAIGHP